MEKSLWKKRLVEEHGEFKIPTTIPTGTELSQISWDHYFDISETYCVNETDFKIYSTNVESGTVFVFLHGAGFSALTWSLVAGHLKQAKLKTLAYDARGHGNLGFVTKLILGQTSSKREDLPAEQLTEDAIAIIKAKCPNSKVVLVGHSMGGAIAARAASLNLLPNLAGLIVIDVVEGTAMAALNSMHQILENRPNQFDSLDNAIQWSGTLKNIDSARVSFPSQLKLREDNFYTWRTDLVNSEQYWKGWFTGLSNLFLSVKVPKLLLLAGTDRLDKDLTIAQMQGKFQLVVLPAVGHVIQEDDPIRTSQSIIQFAQRFRLI